MRHAVRLLIELDRVAAFLILSIVGSSAAQAGLRHADTYVRLVPRQPPLFPRTIPTCLSNMLCVVVRRNDVKRYLRGYRGRAAIIPVYHYGENYRRPL